MPSTSFAAAAGVCRRHARSFHFASYFLPREKRLAAYAVYAFCRQMDDAVDRAPDGSAAATALQDVERRLDRAYEDDLDEVPADDPLHAFAQTVKAYDIPKWTLRDLAEGCRMDLTVTRQPDWPTLERYCYHVAGVVGLIMTRLFRPRDERASRCAVAMGNAMQLTNIVRDIAEDAEIGRIYLPQNELAAFGVPEQDLLNRRTTSQVRQLVRFQVERARSLYALGSHGLSALPNDGSRLTATVMAHVYGGILDDIVRKRYDPFAGRARLTFAQKLARVPAAVRQAWEPA